MHQLVYISSAVGSVAILPIVAVSRVNNLRDGITGLLYADGVRFLQALEGEAAMVERTYQRIARDERHRALVVLSQREVATREFGPWSMAERRGDEANDMLFDRIGTLVAGASPSVRATFDHFAKIQRDPRPPQ
jgi:hypothetical protein